MTIYTKDSDKQPNPNYVPPASNVDEKKFVTIEMFEQYHKKLMEYIGMHDDLILNGETTCPKCGATITSDKCEKCATKKEEE